MNEYRVTVSYVVYHTEQVQVFAENEEEAANMACDQVDPDGDDCEVDKITFVREMTEPYEPPYEDPNQIKMEI